MISRIDWNGVNVRAVVLSAALAAASFVAVGGGNTAFAAEPNPRGAVPKRQTPWTSSRIVGSSEPPSPYVLKRVFPKLKFRDVVELELAASANRWFLLEQNGKLFSFPNHPSSDAADLALDLKKAVPGVTQAYGFTFHPGFATNRHIFICYVLKDGLPDGTRVSRFTVSRSDPPQIDPASEKIIITWLAGGHNGGCLKFGPDGMLYITSGDGSGPNPPDALDTGQDNRDLLSCVLRIDVDRPEPGKNYRVPADNPFLATPDTRPEIFSYGFRNPWKMSFDRATGELWLGDVGWELWELVYRIERGGNYGWSVVEGRQPVKPESKRGSTPILPPTIDHSHTEAASITGGFVYRGKRFKDLIGAYVYGDWQTGKFWALRSEPGKAAAARELVDTDVQVVAFAEDVSGELLIAGYDGTIHEFEPNPAQDTSGQFPRKLSDTGLFTSAAKHVLAPGVARFDVNAPMWSDHGRAERFVALPGESQITVTNGWAFPTNAVLGRTISIEMKAGEPASARRLETQILHFDGTTWNGYTYRWNEAQTDATLVGSDGAEQPLSIEDRDAPGGRREQPWRFQSRAECMRCHNPWSGNVLGFNPLQLSSTSDQARAGSIEALVREGIFAQTVQTPSSRLADPYDVHAPLAARARSWLHVNCAHCHRMHAGGSVLSEMQYDIALEKAKLVDAPPSQGAFGLRDAHVIAPGEPSSSVLLYRLLSTGGGHMPKLGARVVDDRGIEALREWIETMNSGPANGSGSTRRPERDVVRKLVRSGGSSDAPRATIDLLLKSTSGALALAAHMRQLPNDVRREAVEAGAAHPNLLVRDLFERFLPPEKRVRRLGPNVEPQQILALKGDSSRGREVFFREGGAQCSQCHRLNEQGRDFGPDLTKIGQKYDRARLLDQILSPSKIIEAAYVLHQFELKDDSNLSGFVIRESGDELLVKDANLRETSVRTADIVQRSRSQISAMPEGLLETMTAQEAADVLEFLAERK